MKKCPNCNKILPLDSFYRDKSTSSGRKSHCKKCDSERRKKYPRRSKPKPFVYDKKKSREHYLKYRDYYISNSRKWYQNNRKKGNAERKARKAFRLGHISKKNCESCGKIDSVMHHSDYNKPLEVIWFCKGCHSKWHRVNKAIS